MPVAPACFSRAVALARAALALCGPGETRRTVIASGCSSAAWAAERRTPVAARSVTSAQPCGAWNEKPWALSWGPAAGFTLGTAVGLGELVEPGSLAAGSFAVVAVLSSDPQADRASATVTPSAAHEVARLISMCSGYAWGRSRSRGCR